MIRFLKRWVQTLFLVSVAAVVGYFVVLPKVVPLEYEEFVETYAEQYHLELALVYAVIFCESGFRPNAVSPAGAKGLIQIGDDTAIWAAQQIEGMQEEQLEIMDPKTNIQIGCWYLSWLFEKFHGNLQTALAGYNAGHNRVAQWLADEEKSKDGLTLDEIPYEETEQYVGKVKIMKKIYAWRYHV